MIRLGIVVPCYNEEEVLSEANSYLLELLDRLVSEGKVGSDSMIYYVDDGSTDATWLLIESLIQESSRVAGIKLSRNQGHQNALIAGLFTAEGDVLVSIDADLQDDVNTIEKMLDAHYQGAEIVYGVRDDRESDTAFKRLTAQGYYRLIEFLGVEVVYNHADYRLLSRKAINSLKDFREINLFLRGIVPLIGLRSAIVYYKRGERFAGESKYPLKKMLAFALEGITSFSIVPLRIITIVGLLIFSISMLMSLYILLVKLFGDTALPGWASTVLPVYLLGGVQIFFLGIIGEYLGKIYTEVKRRPRYIIEKCINI
jgi:glycosyltransferase involved in cell wall biosynthesis